MIEAFMSKAMQVPKEIARECFKGFTKNYDIKNKVSEIKVPTLIVVGQKGIGTPIKCSQFLKREIENSELRIIPDCGHEVKGFPTPGSC